MYRFEAGKSYFPMDSGAGHLMIIYRTAKMVLVQNESMCMWHMKIHLDDWGDEYIQDSSVPKRWRNAYTYKAKNVED